MLPIQDFYPLITRPSNIVITMHQKPDGDAMGSSLGLFHFLKSLGHQVMVISPTNWADFLQWMPGAKEVMDFEKQKEKSVAIIEKADWIFCLDFNVMHRTKHMEAHLLGSTAIKILIDHHQQPQEEAFTYGVSNTSKSSTCEMVYDFICESGYAHTINEHMAACLYTGVMTDTGSFRFPSTKPSVHRMVAHLKETGLDHSKVHEEIYDNFLENRLRFIGFALLNRMEVFYEFNTALMFISREDLKRFNIKTGDSEGLVNYLLSIQGMKLGAIVIDREGERKWSFRSKGNFDVNIFARTHFSGGGHKNAAGGSSFDSLEKTVAHFKEIIETYKNQLQ